MNKIPKFIILKNTLFNNNKCWVIRGGNTEEISQRMKTEPTYKGMMLPSTQNLKALSLRVFFLIC